MRKKVTITLTFEKIVEGSNDQTCIDKAIYDVIDDFQCNGAVWMVNYHNQAKIEEVK